MTHSKSKKEVFFALHYIYSKRKFKCLPNDFSASDFINNHCTALTFLLVKPILNTSCFGNFLPILMDVTSR